MPRFARRQRGSEPGSAGRGSAERERVTLPALAIARSDLAELGDAIGVLDVDLQSPTAPPAAATRYAEALRSYMAAGERLQRAERPGELVAVGEALERARYELASARARLHGDEPPAHTPPCLFDPRHGPSARPERWSPRGPAAVGGAGGDGARPVPACAADARALADGAAPSVRLVWLGGRSVPYWDVPVLYGPLLRRPPPAVRRRTAPGGAAGGHAARPGARPATSSVRGREGGAARSC